MSDFLAWRTAQLPTAAARIAKREQRAASAWWRLHDKEEPPTAIAFKTAAGVILAPQIVRIEVDNRASDSSSAAGQAPRMQLIVYGVSGYATGEGTEEAVQPLGLLLALTQTTAATTALVEDTDLAEGYRFVFRNDEYRIEDIILVPGEIQGVAVATG